MRILLIILLIAIFMLFLKLIFRVALFILFNRRNIQKIIGALFNATTTNNNSNTNISPKMVKCTKCQLYIPEDKAYQYEGQFYCCKEHSKNQ